MRITNGMITANTKSNINSNKIMVDKYNTQMTTQKKISKASENPVIAIRALRLQTSLNHLNQYVDNNIPDAQSWLNTTETALNNMKKIITDIRTQCVNGATDTLTDEDRKTILQQLSSLVDQIYSEGNADYAGRTVFTGYRTSSQLTFNVDDPDTTYEIKENFTFEDVKEKRYYFGTTTIPATVNNTTADCPDNTTVDNLYRVRLAYEKVSSNNISISFDQDIKIGGQTVPANDAITAASTPALKVYASRAEWEASGNIQDNQEEIILIEETGELIFSDEISDQIMETKAGLNVSYEKTGFDKGEVRPEYYFDCTDLSECTVDATGAWDRTKAVNFTKEDQVISYTIANVTELPVNTQASDVFGPDIQRDVEDMIVAINASVNAHDKIAKVKAMMKEAQYAGEEDQKKLQTYLDAAQKEADYADDNLQKMYGAYISNFDGYLEKINIGITNVGSLTNRLQLTQNRVENQQTTIEELKSNNEDRDISDIIIDYYASQNAYKGSLTAAAQVGRTSLLDYL